MPNLDDLAKRLRRKVYPQGQEGVDALARDIAEGLSGIARQPEIARRLTQTTLADVQGGTSLGVGDAAATHGSEYLVQNPQPGQTPDVGQGLASRRQSRIRATTRTLPAKVKTAAVAGDTEVEVVIVGNTPVQDVDASTTAEVVGSITGAMQQDVADISGLTIMAKVTGQPIVTAGSTGVQPIEAGRSVQVVVNEQWEDSTSWTKRGRKNLPLVTPVLKCRTACLVNGLACASPGCFPAEASSNFFAEGGSSPADDWVPASTTDWTPNRPWCVVEMSIDTADGTLDRDLAEFSYYDYGLVDGSGVINFAGVSYSVPLGSGQYYIYLGLGTQCYGWYLLVGCAVGQEVNFGGISLGAPANYIDPTLVRNWTLIDSNFPIPIP